MWKARREAAGVLTKSIILVRTYGANDFLDAVVIFTIPQIRKTTTENLVTDYGNYTNSPILLFLCGRQGDVPEKKNVRKYHKRKKYRGQLTVLTKLVVIFSSY